MADQSLHTGAPGSHSRRLLLYVHVPVHQGHDGELMIEPQAANGLRLWARNFDHVTVMQPVRADAGGGKMLQPVSQIPGADRITFDPLPMAYRPDRFLRHLPAARQKIRDNIAQADYLCFSLGGLWGDWGAVSSIIAHRMGRPYSVWTDRVESKVARHNARTGQGRSALRSRLDWRPMAALEKWVIRRAALGLFHGRETYDAYARFCRQPQLVHDIHVGKSDHISPDALPCKQHAAAEGPLRIVYAGRADPMKGPLDWVEVLAMLARRGVDFRATWLGDGPLLAEMRAAIDAAGLTLKIELPGFVSDRGTVLEALRQAHVMLFCHKTPESPRCLIEALVSGTPLIGYEGTFAADLISGHGGGQLAPMDDTAALAYILANLAQDRTKLADMMKRAVRDSSEFHDEAVFEHRACLIRDHL
ncbi:glycosyltransferase [Paracoccus shandongensis]|uniref:glycosyltransferase n=1 Tax=Paracoccus shandongensis TaxID=2816048 RepID=UPI001A8C71B5|nr:glycosyltransferase [Paracoccus shandongensis]